MATLHLSNLPNTKTPYTPVNNKPQIARRVTLQQNRAQRPHQPTEKSPESSTGTAGSTTLPSPALTPRWSNHRNKALKNPVYKSITSAYRHLLNLQKNKPSPQLLNELEGYADIQRALPRREQNKIIPGFPIPPETMRLLLTHLKRLGVNLDKMDVGASVNANPYPMRPHP